MNTADFLYPRDLEVTPTKWKKVLFIGSCLSETYVKTFRSRRPDLVFDHTLFNNCIELPSKTNDELASYDLQYVQLPLRSILGDRIVRIRDAESRNNDWIALGKRAIDQMLFSAMAYNIQSGLLTLLSNFVVPQGRVAPSLFDHDSETDLVRIVRELNAYISDQAKRFPNTYVADVDAIANSLGKRYFLDDIIYFYTHGSVFYTDWSGHERYPQWSAPAPGRIDEIRDLGTTYENRIDDFFDTVFRQMEAMYRTIRQIDTVKIVIFDLDNTLWRGQIAEHYSLGDTWPYADGWPMGIWEAVHHLRRRGIMVTLASKNDSDLVVAKWTDVVQPSFVKFEDFLAPQINWRPKAENILVTLKQLALTPQSALFVDDNPVERESVKSLIPGIRVIGSDPFVTRRVLLWSPEMQVARLTEESARREQMLEKQIIREQQKSQMSRQEFLSSLESRVTLWKIRDSTHSSFIRVFELLNKTNQFNTNGRRWSTEECQQHFHSGGLIYAFSVVDRFTDYGTVGAALTLGREIVQLVMSCRVIGMDIELAVLDGLANMMRSDGKPDCIVGRIVFTESNAPGRDVYARAGFQEKAANTFTLEKSIAIPSARHVSVVLAEA